MFLARAFLHAGDRLLEHFFADLPHLAEDGFQAAMVSDGFLVESGLLCGKSEADRLGLHLAGEPPGMGELRAHSALGDPAELLELSLESVVTPREAVERARR